MRTAEATVRSDARDLDGVAPEWMHPLLRRLRTLGDIPADELSDLVANLTGRMRYPAGDQPLAEPGRERPLFILKGWAASERRLPDGRRQIMRLLVPGDLIGPAAGVGARGLPIVALTPLETVSAAAAVEMALKRPDGGVRRALARSAWRDEQLILDQVRRTGRLGGAERLADLLVELRDRLAQTGLGDRRRFPLPLTQEVLADTLGLSVVHVSRLKAELKSEGLVEWRGGLVTLPDPERLATLACRTARDA
jgi:CRP-like cAMP-binding protein